MSYPEEDRRCTPACPIEPIKFGRLLQSMDTLVITVQEHGRKIDSLIESRSENKGVSKTIIFGIPMLAGGLGAILSKWLHL